MISLIAFLVSAESFAQRRMTLSDCLKIAHAQAPSLIEAKRNYEIATFTAQAQDRSLRSKVDLTLSAPIYSDNTSPIYNPVTGTTDLLKQENLQYGGALTISQPIFWTGGLLSVEGDLFRRSQGTLSGTKINDYLGVGSISLYQPLFKSNEYKLESREAEMSTDQARASYLGQWVSVDFQIENAFFTLFETTEELKIKHDEVDASQANYQLATNKYKAGLIAEVDALQLEVDLATAQTDLFDTERRHKAAERSLLSALGMPLDEKVSAQIDTLVEITVKLNPDEAGRQALSRRQDVLSARYDIERQEIAQDRVRNGRTISAALTGSFGASNNGDPISVLADKPYLNRGLTLSVNIPVLDWGAQSSRLDAAQASIEVSRIALVVKERQVEQEVLGVLEQLGSAQQQVEVAKKSGIVAQKAYDLSRARFDAGKITSQDLSLAQDRLTRARLSALTAEVAEHLALADLRQKTLFDYATGTAVQGDMQ